jgi:hypothetical protein
MTKRSKSKKTKWLVAVAFVLFASVLTTSLLMYRGQPSPPKKTPDQYFSFSNIGAWATNVSKTFIKIKVLYFTITATGGDAHHLALFLPGMADPLDNYQYDRATNGTALPVEITFPSEVSSTKKEQGFPINIKLWCDEAEGTVTLYVPETGIFT